MRFVYDKRKAASNLRKHGVGFDEATTVFGDTLNVTIPDPEHSVREHRFVTIGFSAASRLVVVCHAEEEDVIRIISAREATSHEKKRHESQA